MASGIDASWQNMCEAAMSVENLLIASTEYSTEPELNFKQFTYCYHQYPIMTAVANLVLVEIGIYLKDDLEDELSEDGSDRIEQSDLHNMLDDSFGMNS